MTIVRGCLFVCALMTNLGSLAYVRLKLKLNRHLLNILTLHLIVVISGLLLTILGYCLVDIGEVRNLYTCSLFNLPTFATFVSSYLFPAAIAVIR